MGIVRVVLLCIAIWLLWIVIKKVRLKKLEYTQKISKTTPIEPIQKCKFCGLHLPEHEAFQVSGRYFCNKDHFDKYLSLNSDRE